MRISAMRRGRRDTSARLRRPVSGLREFVSNWIQRNAPATPVQRNFTLKVYQLTDALTHMENATQIETLGASHAASGKCHAEPLFGVAEKRIS